MSDEPEKHASDEKASPSLTQKLAFIERLERELIRKASEEMKKHPEIYVSDFFVIGAVRRTLAQAKGFRELIAAKNFPCAAGILRMQLDTAMRLNGFRISNNRDEMAAAILGGVAMNKLKSPTGERMHDGYLRKLLAEDHPWISQVYEETSDFIHLSGRHFYNAIQSLEEDSRIVHLSISGEDPKRPEADYFEIVDAFLDATKIAAMLGLSYMASKNMIPPGKHEG